MWKLTLGVLTWCCVGAGCWGTLAAEAPDYDNVCGVPVHHALVEIGQYKPPHIFMPESKPEGVEFNYLTESKEPLSAMCFRNKEEASLFTVPLPAGLTRCTFSEGKLSCWKGGGAAAASAGTRPAAAARSGDKSAAASAPNMDFSKSPCLKYATKFNKAIAARIYAHVNEKSELTIDNGTPGWNLSFGAVNTDMAIDYAIRSVSDGWAIYQLIDPAKGQAAVFLVQYMFGDMTGKNEACLLGPDAPMPVSVDEIAPVAVKMYAEHLVAKPAPTLEGMRRQLKDYLIAASAAVTGDPVLAQFPAEVRPFLKEGCADNQKKGLPADAVTRMDIDGDGRQDYLIDWGGLTCDGALFFGTAGYPKDIIMGTSHGLVKVLEADDQGAEVKRFKGFATFEGAVYAPAAAGGDMRYHNMYVLKHGKAYKVRSIPKGGKVVHTFGG